MSFEEQELRRRLAETAALAGPPRVSNASLIRRIRWRRARTTAAASGVLLAAAAVAVAVPAALAGTGGTLAKAPSLPGAVQRPAGDVPATSGTRPTFTVAVSGSRASQGYAPPSTGGAGFAAAPGERLVMRVGVRVPAHVKVTALWLGISRGTLGSPTDLSPVLAHTRAPLGPGTHSFTLHWTVPAGLRPGTRLYLATQWDVRQGSIGQYISRFTVRSGRVRPGPPSAAPAVGSPVPAPAAWRLRSTASRTEFTVPSPSRS